MAIADIPEVYGGPFADETDVLQAEINKAVEEDREPDFDKVTENWETISAGTKAWLEQPYLFVSVTPEPIVENVKAEAVEESDPIFSDTPLYDGILGGDE